MAIVKNNTITEIPIYGSSRIGQFEPSNTHSSSSIGTAHHKFEYSNHLGNVLATTDDLGNVFSYSDYYPFGLSMEGRSWSDDGYRYGFNGKEKDNDLAKSNYDFGARIYNPIIGRWLSPDPLELSTPYYSTYQSFCNSPISIIDPDGKSGIVSFDKNGNGGKGEIVVSSNIFFYGEGDAALSTAVSNNMMSVLNEASKGLLFRYQGQDGEYPVRFEINSEFGTMEQALERINNDPGNPINNYVRFSKGIKSFTQPQPVDLYVNKVTGNQYIEKSDRFIQLAAGSNSFIFNIDDLLDGKTITSHEFLHGLGYLNKSQSNFNIPYLSEVKNSTKFTLTPKGDKEKMKKYFEILQSYDGSHNNIPLNGVPTIMTQGHAIEYINKSYLLIESKVDSRKVKKDNSDIFNIFRSKKISPTKKHQSLGKTNDKIFNDKGDVIN
ncbi:RHS repeat-associated core domain-containing protein [Flammeovirga yaeyamensis]|uniref:RHS repeat-associated core domain-containing protein n=1 Tax=Flammeovirga yaeyamensis TaxID=367791 RepID=A0AAX1N9L0_9BACT|nr:RHS repeat-associated core domain-containing protein [Flammeovirga yaeyamensis]MBB3699415.1 RHS repeat-associated protein [Flammeovirga yaeyamensis]NMF35326.1 RHS repeat-associated core domain-containing protein [Flammeovirga yaeyamensis]QWG04186.1 RHS repeat-associated core domain-containing protein [Flammeovirga yaeyamensis]